MGLRLDLQNLLKTITANVYFQPPENIKVQYPCIIYERDGSNLEHAANRLYRHTKRYQVTVIDRNPDSALPDMVIELPMCEFVRSYTADNLNHYVFNLFF